MNKKTWLHDNVAAILALSFSFFCFYIYRLVLLKEINTTENIVFLIISSITNIVMLIVGYFFGSSAGSKAKQAALDKINDSTTSITESVKIEDQPKE